MKNILLLVVSGACFLSPAFSQNPWTLKQAIDYAIEHNISVKQANIASLQAEVDFRENSFRAYPSASFGNNWSMSFGRRENPVTGIFENTKAISSGFTFNSSFLIYNFYGQHNANQALRLTQKATEATEEKAKNDIALRVANAFLLVLQAKEQVNINRLQITLTQEQLNVTRKRVEAGALPELNAAQIEAQLALDSTTYVSSVGNRELQLLQLKAILNLDAAVAFDVVAPPIDLIPIENIADLQPEIVYTLALANLPQQRINDLKVKAAEKNAKAVRAQMYPALGGFAGLSTNFFGPLARTIPGGNITGEEVTGLFVRTPTDIYNVISPTYGGTRTINKTFSEIWEGFGSQLNRNFGQGIGISINVPIFNGFQARSNYSRAKLNIRNIQLQKDLDNQILKQDIYSAYNNALSALQQNSSSRKAVETSQRAYELSRKRYDVNLLSAFELITTQNNLFRAQIDFLLSRYNYVFTMKVLEFYKGQGLKL